MAGRLPALRDLANRFPGTPDDKELAYAVSEKAVAYLIDTYGTEKMAAVLATYKEGTRSTDAALSTVYGLTSRDLDDAWRRDFAATPQPTVQTVLLVLAGGVLLVLNAIVALIAAGGVWLARRKPA